MNYHKRGEAMNRWIGWLIGKEYMNFLLDLAGEDSKSPRKSRAFRGLFWE